MTGQSFRMSHVAQEKDDYGDANDMEENDLDLDTCMLYSPSCCMMT